ncbi:hypothetical protein [Cryobacterium cryoconiti]|uniref:Uncharacterized protein n=1 Tax=Cryobacterium cryoconiti TaxID=1259239 RepID=A0A4Y8JY10_9MICO|nr:hypothetical protein [Cryobacterium cryoconiti]TFD27485.1 hypothetical protein E3T49_13150 [Cryobacterium cryoconiti]
MSAAAMAAAITALGFKVQDAPWDMHRSVTAKRGQVGIYRLAVDGTLKWGWVETPEGRVDVHCWMDYRTALETVRR